jgi:hypothetical protein
MKATIYRKFTLSMILFMLVSLVPGGIRPGSVSAQGASSSAQQSGNIQQTGATQAASSLIYTQTSTVKVLGNRRLVVPPVGAFQTTEESELVQSLNEKPQAEKEQPQPEQPKQLAQPSSNSPKQPFATKAITRPTTPGTCDTAGPIEVESSGGTAAGVPTPYATLQGAFDAINLGVLHLGTITIDVCGDTTETVTATLNQVAGVTSVMISPAGGAARTISGAITSGSPLINLNGADNVTIDGLNTAGNSLTISNTTAGGTTTSTIRFVSDATNNTIQNTTILGSGTSITSGTVYFTTGTTAGNDGNIITNNNIGPAGANLPTNAIYSLGTSAAIDNSGITISSNNIFDYFNATLVSVGINVSSTGNSAWTINSNRLYQTATRIYTAAQTHNGINIGVGSGYTISGNTIGFANASGTGTTNMAGITTPGTFSGTFPSSYSLGTATLNATRYIGISAAFTAGGTVSQIQGNTIGGFALLTSSGATSTNGIWCGINVTSGNANIGTTTGNTIGATTGPSSVYAATSTTGGQVVGIFATSTNTVSIQNNTIASIDSVGTTATQAGGITAIDTAGTAGVFTISNNTIGNTTTENIRAGYTLAGANLSNGGTLTSTTGATAFLMGIRNAATGATLSITSNLLRGWATSGTVTAVTGITSTGVNTTSVTISGNQLGYSGLGWLRYNFANSGALTGISKSGSSSTATLAMSVNDFQGITHLVAGSSTHTYIINTATTLSQAINSNTFTNLNVNTTGSVTFISNDVALPATGSVNANNNLIVTAFNKGGAGGTVSLYLTTGGPSSAIGSTKTEQNNNFSNITVTGSTSIQGWFDIEGATGGGPVKTITNNTFNNWAGGTGSITVMQTGYGYNGSSISSNTMTNITGQGSITGISINSTNGGTTQAYSSNSITSLISSGTGGSVIGITGGSSSITTLTMASNIINTLSSTGASSTVAGIQITSGATVNLNGNTINTLSSSGTTSPVVIGISASSGTTINVFKNKIYDLLVSGAISTTSPAVNGLLFSGGTTVSAYNNLIGDLRATAANLTDAIRGISITSSTSSTTYNIYYNTIYINATSSGANFGTTGIFHTTSATSTTAALNLRNNIIVNTSTPNGTGLTVAYRRSSTTLTNYASTSNNNDFYAGAPSATRLIFYDGTNSDQTITAYKTRVSPRDSASFSENPPFLSTVGSSANFLHIDTTVATQLEGGGAPISGITDDFDGNTRNASTPDVGADEFAGTPLDLVGPSITYTPFGNTSFTTNRTLSVTITDLSGVAGGALAPRIYYRKNGGSYVSTQCGAPTGNVYPCTIDYSLVGGVTLGDVIDYFVIAQDTAGNVAANPGGGLVASNVNTVTTPPTTPNTYTIVAAFPASVTVGSGGTYPSLTNSGGLFQAMNAAVFTGNVVVDIISDLTGELGTFALNQLAEDGVGGYTVLIKPSGAARAVSGTAAGAGLIKLNGADRVTIDGSLSGGTDRSLTITNLSTTGATVWIASASTSNGANNNTIKNTNLFGNTGQTSVAGVMAGSGTSFGGNADSPNNNNTIQNNLINKVQSAVFQAGNVTSMDQNWSVIDNTLGSAVVADKLGFRGIFLSYAQNLLINNNSISGINSSTSTSSTMSGIVVFGTISGGTIARNNIRDIRQNNTTGWGSNGIFLAATSTASNLTVANNMISDIASQGFNGATSSDNGYGIMIETGAGYKIYYNSVNMNTNQVASGSITAAFNIAAAVTTVGGIDLRDNILADTQTIGTRYAVYDAAGLATIFSNINYNDYFAQNVGFLTSTRTSLANWQAATLQDANSMAVNPLFVSTTDLHLQGTSPVLGMGTPIAGVTNDFDNDPRPASNPDMGADEVVQAVGGVIPAGTFYNVAAAGGDTLGGNVTVTNTLWLNGILNTGANTLTLDCTAAVMGAGATNYVIGNVRKNLCATGAFSFPVGTANGYSQLDANVTALPTNPSSLTVVAVQAQQPALGGPGPFLQRYWTLTEAGDLTANMVFHYLDGDVAGTEANYRLIRVEGSTAVSFPNDCPTPAVGKACVDTAANTATIPGVNTFSDWTLGEPVAPTAARLESLTATRASNGTLIEWKTGYEVSNLGFNLYRSEGEKGTRTLVNPASSLIAGSAFMSGGGAAPAGRSYTWLDSARTTTNTRYWLEDVDMKGKATMHGPYSTVAAKAGLDISKQQANQSPLLSALGQAQGAIRPVERVGSSTAPKSSPANITINPQASQAAVKLSVKQEGFYRVTQAQLAAAGLDANADPRNLQMFVDGTQVPIRVNGEADGRLDASDSVEFYGLALDTPSTNTRVYWLVVGAQAGMRVETVKSGGNLTSGGSFPYTVERRDRTIYFAGLLNGDAENFFGPLVTGQGSAQTISITNHDAASSSQAVVQVALQGVTAQAHTVSVKLNGTAVGVVNFSGTENKVASFNVAQALLQEGANTVTLTSTGAGSDVSLTDYIRITYAHTYRADNDTLRLTAQGGSQVTVDGFTTAKVRVLDVTNPAAPVELTGAGSAQGGAYSVSLTVPGTGERTLLAIENGKALPVSSAGRNQPTSWGTNGQGADLVIVAHNNVIDSLKPLAAYRNSQGYKVAVVNIEDVYDEFSYGAHSPQALRDFLSYANSNWSVKPRYLLLAGDSSFDARGYLGAGEWDLVPSKLIDTQYLEANSDDWLADFTNDGIADLAMGRLPVRTSAEAALMVQKIISYDQSGTATTGGALLVSGTNDSYNFEEANARVGDIVSKQMPVQQINRGSRDPAVVKQEIISAINAGQKIVNYIGHGSVDLWGGSVFNNADARALSNGQNLPFVVAMTCLNGYSTDPTLDSLAESFMKAERGGAIAVWTSTGMTTPELQNTMNQALYSAMFNGTPNPAMQPLPIRPTFGEAVMTAKASVSDPDVRRTWILFGDPMSKLR